ncbi:plasmid mobilization relaxosome protein MobC [Vibrio parahaemolyticus]|jgi:hypothetical protein|uniref:plasmid mobilization relaxosome protein MobC n=1 Tax=Bacteria TaxID=2 RepID=UPI000878736F|nr:MULTISPECIES: plasmid mobilization relaxosome protein MobC [Bacteria]MCF9776869.1 plasmid mobilization relaxosome protein MobC [Vibrio parahaemolyticus]MCF9818298.1 plasmid mobilization relaxosome protein MobC [Vibrio parahaemolyticus]MDF4677536.1 plasmid mobilization relaxosome protein MobC [Vibrio parahaemolyticus]MDF5109301.1 plasmid mobilization relaxosome protein MobC [Vibrio parahaemolyticus]MDF5124295.1 plasmid mobilization relaxosome protein MobC [Vibrio parahaemolyticus]
MDHTKSQRRNKSVNLLFSLDELEKIKSKAIGSPATWIRNTALNYESVPLLESTPREHEVKIRVTEDEWGVLNQKSGSVPLAAWLRNLALQTHVHKAKSAELKEQQKSFKPVDPALLRQIAAVGNNLNQISRKVHLQFANGGFNSSALLMQLSVLEGQLNHLIQMHSVEADDR